MPFPGCKVTPLVTLEDTLNITRRIDNVRMQSNIVISDQRRNALLEKIAARGAYRARRLAYEVEKLEKDHGYVNCRISVDTIASLLSGSLRVIERQQLERLEQTVDALPAIQPGRSIPLTVDMIADLRSLVGGRGAFGPSRLFQFIEDYEIDNDLPGTGITVEIINGILMGEEKLVDENQWRRLNEVVATMPPQVDIRAGTPAREYLENLLVEKNDPSARRIFNAMPPEAKEANGSGVAQFRTYHLIERILEYRQDYLHLSQYEILAAAIQNVKDPKPLTESQVVGWIVATQEKTGKTPNTSDKIVWCAVANDEFEVVQGEHWQNIDRAIKRRLRGLANEDGSAIAESLSDLKFKHGLVRDRTLTEGLIVSWIMATHKKTGRYPTTETEDVWCEGNDASFSIIEKESWRKINDAIANKMRGLVEADGSPIAASLLDLRKKNGLFDDRNLTEAQIVSWIIATTRKTGKIPSDLSKDIWAEKADGEYELVANETWSRINSALARKYRGLINEDGSAVALSLADLKQKHGLDEIPLSEDQLLNWVEATEAQTGKFPTAADTTVFQRVPNGEITVVAGEKWSLIDRSLRFGLRGLVYADGTQIATGLSDLKRKLGLLSEHINLTENQIVGWLIATQDKTGKLPASEDKEVWERHDDGSYHVVPHETWIGINGALVGRGRGLVNEDGSPIASSLADLKRKHGFVADKDKLSEEQLVEWIKIFKHKTGKYPSAADDIVWQQLPNGSFEQVKGETWGAFEHALRKKQRGLINPDDSRIARTLLELKERHGFVNPQLSREIIVDWILATHEKTGKAPTGNTKEVWRKTSDGSFELVEGENWNAINAALVTGRRGLANADGTINSTSLRALKIELKLKDEAAPISEQQIILWMYSTQEKNGKSPSIEDKTVWHRAADGKFERVKGVTWQTINYALRHGYRILPNEDGTPVAKSLAALRDKIGMETHRSRVGRRGSKPSNTPERPDSRQNARHVREGRQPG
ncbi:MAG: hypothetical protein AB7H97_14555 [Pseudobdellovibrionaceae bacterium]